MEYTLVVDQLALKRWHGKIDGDDCLLIAFISKLNSHNPEIAQYMKGDYFRLNRSWMLTELPLLDFTEYTLSRRLHQLEKLGLLDLENPHGQGGHLLLYGRMSKLWYQEVEKAKKEVERHSTTTEQKSHMAEMPHGETDREHLRPMPVANATHDHIKNDHEEEPAAALLEGAALRKLGIGRTESQEEAVMSIIGAMNALGVIDEDKALDVAEHGPVTVHVQMEG